MLKRVFLFVITNLLIVVTVSIILSFLGVNQYYQGDYVSLAIFCTVWGFTGAFISLAISRIVAKKFMGVRLIDPNNPQSADERFLVDSVRRFSSHAGLPLPQIGIYENPEVNAFATGPTKKRSLVAVSSGLLMRMNKEQVEGVLAHEVAHIANGDMVTMTLLQGIVNSFVMFLARVVAGILTQNADEDKRFMMRMLITFALEIALGFLGMMVVSAFSRRREFRADAGGAKLGGREQMIAALEGLRRLKELPVDKSAPSLAAFKISGGGQSRFAALFSTHPPLEARIKALREYM